MKTPLPSAEETPARPFTKVGDKGEGEPMSLMAVKIQIMKWQIRFLKLKQQRLRDRRAV
jgi:hypothetical protein